MGRARVLMAGAAACAAYWLVLRSPILIEPEHALAWRSADDRHRAEASGAR